MYKACILDMDGTIVNTLNSIADIGNRALRQLGFFEIPVETYKTLVGNGADKLMRAMLNTVGEEETPETVAALRTVYDKIYAADPTHLVTIYPGISRTLNEIKSAGVALAVLSNKPDDMVRQVADSLFPNLFDDVRGQRAETPLKPDPTALLEIIEIFSLSPRDVLFCGDSGVDMMTGNQAGVDTCGVLWGFREKEELVSAGAKQLVSDALSLQKLVMSGIV